MTTWRSLFILVLTAIFSSGGVCTAGEWDLLTAQNSVSSLTWNTYDTRTYEPMNLSQTETGEGNAAKKPSPLSGVNTIELHKYLGYTTVLLAAVAAVSSGTKSVHWAAAYGTAGVAAMTVTTGSIAHGNRFTLEDGWFTQDNTHILLGTIGAIGCIAAVAIADSDGGGGHASAGVFGGAAMALSVVTIRW